MGSNSPSSWAAIARYRLNARAVRSYSRIGAVEDRALACPVSAISIKTPRLRHFDFMPSNDASCLPSAGSLAAENHP
jgi:hypothetical protein